MTRRLPIFLFLAVFGCGVTDPEFPRGGDLPALEAVSGQGLRFELRTESPPDSAAWSRARVVLSNSRPDSVSAQFGLCLFDAVLFAEGAWTAPAWSEPRPNLCPAGALIVDLAPRESVTTDWWSITRSHSEILGDRLPEGWYRFGAEVSLDGAFGETALIVAPDSTWLRRP